MGNKIPVESEFDVRFLKKTKITFALVYLLFMSARAVFNPFITVYLKEKGLDVELIGIIMGINSVIIILAQPFWGLVSDKLQSEKSALIICLISQGLVSLLLITSRGFFLIALCFCVYTFFSSPEGTLLDTWSLNAIKKVKDEKSLGRLKLWGCLGFAASSILSGIFINNRSTSDIIPAFSIILLIIAGIMFIIRIDTQRYRPIKLKEINFSLIYKNKSFLVFLGFVVLMQFPHRAAYTFYPALLQHLGGSKNMVGYCSAIMFVSEAILLFLSKKLLANISAKYLILGSALFFTLWQIGYALSTSPFHIMLLSLLDGPSFALFTIGTLYYLDAIAPKQLRVTYQAIAYAFYYGISGVIGNTLGGLIIGGFGYRAMYIIGAVSIVLVTMVFIMADRAIEKKQEAL
ncbi:MAG: MFS transporter [Treponema sp.]|nr:MFS transporter [Treponema sp.]